MARILHRSHLEEPKCHDGSFCCGIDEKADRCCSSGTGVWIENGTMTDRPVGLSRSKVSSSRGASTSNTGTADNGLGFKTSSTLPTSSRPPTSAPAPSSPSKPATKSSIGLVAGSIVGSIGAAALTFGAIHILKHLVSRRKNADSPNPHTESFQIPSPGVEEVDGFERPYETDGRQRHETDGQARHEMRGAECELPAIELLDDYFAEPSTSA
ncbi:MAG: hypothetical protein Q9167_003780 [Letrouitia subvulpina]